MWTPRILPANAPRANQQVTYLFFNETLGYHGLMTIDNTFMAVGGGNLPFGTTTGVNTYVAALTPRSAGANRTINVKFANANTGASTLNIDSEGVVALQNASGGALTNGQIVAGTIYQVVKDGNAYKILNIYSAE